VTTARTLGSGLQGVGVSCRYPKIKHPEREPKN
jgi:hypothetical protein